ncbi:hypothetical protein EB796_024172 [Bugula neritina]|uniref:Uncharacterized protein n=1 Tax=Bugula neritina TaxID=10212 RepID=A0A7J7IUM2_BUGNE|nr:hypothetical protein EB796_024172 [Bugula neritina]
MCYELTSVVIDLAPKQVRVNSVKYKCSFLKRIASGYPLGRVEQPEEVAKAIAFLGNSESSLSTGVLLELDAGVHLFATNYE